jgi:hypothetical protein
MDRGPDRRHDRDDPVGDPGWPSSPPTRGVLVKRHGLRPVVPLAPGRLAVSLGKVRS